MEVKADHQNRMPVLTGRGPNCPEGRRWEFQTLRVPGSVINIPLELSTAYLPDQEVGGDFSMSLIVASSFSVMSRTND